MFNRKVQRQKRHIRLRQRVVGTAARPRMSICITNKHMYVQFIDDDAGKTLALSLGFASPKLYPIPEGITITVENDGLQVTVTGVDKDKVGEAAARIRSFYPAEPYKGKGIKYEGEHIRRKQGKKVA